MNSCAAIETDDETGAGKSVRERRCIVSGEVMADEKIVRFAVDPDGVIVPDVAALLPGRGIWVGATRAAVDKAVEKNLFSKAAKAKVRATPDLADRVEGRLAAQMLGDLGLARRAGQLLLGFDNVLRALESRTPPAVLVEARDGASDGRRKLLQAASAWGRKVEVIEALDCAELSLALGRENVVHAALKPGRLAERLILDARRLAGFRVPNERHA